jgi:hypothetical protein
MRKSCPQDALIRKFQEEIRHLQSELAVAKSVQTNAPSRGPETSSKDDASASQDGTQSTALDAAFVEQVNAHNVVLQAVL